VYNSDTDEITTSLGSDYSDADSVDVELTTHDDVGFFTVSDQVGFFNALSA